MEDTSRPAVSSKPLHDKPYVSTQALSGGSPVLHATDFTEWPESQLTVASVDNKLLRVFDGPRVLYTDGFSRRDLSIRASYFDAPATFAASIGVIAGTKADSALLQFSAAYLRSSLAQYFLMMRGWKMLCQRNAVHLTDIKSFPFFRAAEAPDPVAAQTALDRVAMRMGCACPA